MKKLGWFVTGAIAVLLLAGIAVPAFVKNRSDGFSARSRPSSLEQWGAGKLRALSLPAAAKNRTNPVAESAEVLADARAHWADHCATCHANDGSGDVAMGKHMYPPAPDMRQAATQNLTDGELFFVIQNGIRFTGMPAWGADPGGQGAHSNHDEQDSWKLVHFIRHLPKMTQDEVRQMEQMNPKTPDELKEEQEERDFLNGVESNETGKKNEPGKHQH